MAVKTFRDSRKLPHRYQQLFALVADVESYPEFIPWVQAVRIVGRGHQLIRSQMEISFLGFTETIASRIFLDGQQQWIRIYERGESTKQRHSEWRFTRLANQWTEIHFLTSFEMYSAILQFAANQFFSSSSSKIIDSFQERAKEKLPILPEQN